MPEPAPAWVVPAMRAGYLARGTVYGLVGVLALRAAWHGGYAEGASRALGELNHGGAGEIVLWLIVGGCFGFALWGLLAAWMDLDCRGRDLKGIFARLDLAGTGVLYAAIGVYVLHLAALGGGGGDGNSRERWTGWLLSKPLGPWIVIAIGMGFIAAAIWYGYKALAEKYKERLRDTPTVERLDPVCKFGWIAYGVVVGILGCFLIWAGWTVDPEHAGGLADAFATVRQAAFGRVMLGVLAVGVISFAVECFVEAVYRVVPARHGVDAPTLATRARAAKAAAPGGGPSQPRPS